MQRHFKLRSSRFLVLVIAFLGLATLLSLWLLPLPPWVLLPLMAGVLCWAGYCLLLDAKLRMGRSCVAFRLDGREEIVLVLRRGSHLPGRVLPYSLVTPYLVILGIMQDEHSGRRNILIMPDAMNAESFRRLRIALRWGDKADRAISV